MNFENWSYYDLLYAVPVRVFDLIVPVPVLYVVENWNVKSD
jgi:hypothetical protein